MVLTATAAYQKFPEIFQKPTRISIQVKSAAPALLFIAKEQGEIQNVPNDGLSMDNPATSTPNLPWADWWQGELWYSCTGAATAVFAFEILTT